jgi:lauroyl/myristoyl acyltransferase
MSSRIQPESFSFVLRAIAQLAIGFVCLLPMRWAAQLGRRCGQMAYFIDARHRRVARKNLTACFAATKTPEEISAIAHENFKRIGENICCAIKSASMDEEAVSHVLDLQQSHSENSDRALTARNVLLASGHFGSFEMFSRIVPHFQTYRHAATYRGIRPESLDQLLKGLRSKAGMVMYERRAGAELLKKELKDGGLMLLLFSDQSDRENGLELPFLGRPAFTNRAPAVMASRYDCALFVPICYRVGLGQYRIEMGEPIATRLPDGTKRSCDAITRDINFAYEAAILRDPANWFWVHNRWKQKALKAHPANPSPMAESFKPLPIS